MHHYSLQPISVSLVLLILAVLCAVLSLIRYSQPTPFSRVDWRGISWLLFLLSLLL